VGTIPATGGSSNDGQAIGWAVILLGLGGIALLVRRRPETA
jgi:MYXO-CTERM domain-containing protein